VLVWCNLEIVRSVNVNGEGGWTARVQVLRFAPPPPGRKHINRPYDHYFDKNYTTASDLAPVAEELKAEAGAEEKIKRFPVHQKLHQSVPVL